MHVGNCAPLLNRNAGCLTQEKGGLPRDSSANAAILARAHEWPAMCGAGILAVSDLPTVRPVAGAGTPQVCWVLGYNPCHTRRAAPGRRARGNWSCLQQYTPFNTHPLGSTV